MLQRILKFGSEHWIRGLSPSEYYDGGSAIYTGEGVNIFRTSGRLSTGFLPTIIGSGTIADNIRWMVSDDFENTLMYAYGDTGKIYKININDTVSVLKDTITSSNGNGLIFYKDKLIYAIGTIVGKCSNPDSSTPTFDDDGINGGAVMLGVANHPMKVGADQKCYVGNSYKLAMFSDVASTPSADWDASKLTFQETYRINSLENDGFYLVIGLTTDSRVAQPRSYVAYWDMVSGQVNRWYQIPKCGEIQYLFCQEGQTYIFTKTAIYVSNFDTPPKLWFYRNDIICGGGNGAIATELNGELRWGGGNEITSYGSGGLNLPKVFYQPEKISVISTITSIFSNPEKNRFFVAGKTNKLYEFSTGSNTGVIVTTPYIDLGRYWKLHYLKIITEPLASGDSLTLSLKSASGGSELLNATTFTYSADGAKTTKNLLINGKIVSQIQLTITFTAGTVKIKSIELYGEPLSELYSE